MSRRQNTFHQALEPTVNSIGYVLWGIEYLGQGKHSLLRLYIDQESGVGIGDCEKVSREISALLDVEDLIQTEYTLEVSSPGVDRPLFTLEQFKHYVGEKVSLKLRMAVDNKRRFSAELIEVTEDSIKVKVDDSELIIADSNVEKANLIGRT